MPTFREIIENAASAVNNLKHPNISEALVAIDEVLHAQGHGYIGNETVDSIELFDDGDVRINTSYTSKGYADCDSYTIPAEIVDAPNPVRAATELTLRKKLTKTVTELNTARQRIPVLEEASERAALALATFLKSA